MDRQAFIALLQPRTDSTWFQLASDKAQLSAAELGNFLGVSRAVVLQARLRGFVPAPKVVSYSHERAYSSRRYISEFEYRWPVGVVRAWLKTIEPELKALK